MRAGLILFLTLGIHFVFAQENDEYDTVKTRPFDRFWTKPRLAPKVGVGTQERVFVEVGFQWHSIYKHPLTLASHGPYFTVDFFIDDQNFLMGPKLGYEFTAGVFGIAADMTYFYDHNYDGEGNNRKSLVFTPKAGLTILGFADLFYGYQIPLSSEENRVSTIYRNRFSLVITLNKDYFNIKEARRKK
jgi:hypothetical protein